MGEALSALAKTLESVTLRPARPDDLPAVLAVIDAAGLPTQGVAECLAGFTIAEHAGAIAGVAGLELHGQYGLLRSVAVAGEWRGRGLGGALTADVLVRAQREGLQSVFLLTDTAAGYFPRHGFRQVERSTVPAAIQASTEYRELCPSTSIVMEKPLRETESRPETV